MIAGVVFDRVGGAAMILIALVWGLRLRAWNRQQKRRKRFDELSDHVD